MLQVIPSARRMVQSLRDLGYDFPTAVADLVDNSLTAGAKHVSVEITFQGARSWVRITDDGRGMRPERLTEAFRYGSSGSYGARDLGKFGLGLKTASLSQCRRLSVASKGTRGPLAGRRLDLDYVTKRDRWEIVEVDPNADPRMRIPQPTGTVVLWEDLDRVLQYADPSSEWARAGMRALAERTDQYLGMVFHRFLDGSAHGGRLLKITVNGTPVEAWDPFSRDQTGTREYASGALDISSANGSGTVHYSSFILPAKERYSSEAAFRRAAGPRKWNRQQGFYIYRADRMIQSGGWSWMRTADEHTKLARVSLDFLPVLDAAFGINVAKVTVTLPPGLRDLLVGPVAAVVKEAQAAYRTKPSSAGSLIPSKDGGQSRGAEARRPAGWIAEALNTAAGAVHERKALTRIAEQVRKDAPEVARDIGW